MDIIVDNKKETWDFNKISVLKFSLRLAFKSIKNITFAVKRKYRYDQLFFRLFNGINANKNLIDFTFYLQQFSA